MCQKYDDETSRLKLQQWELKIRWVWDVNSIQTERRGNRHLFKWKCDALSLHPACSTEMFGDVFAAAEGRTVTEIKSNMRQLLCHFWDLNRHNFCMISSLNTWSNDHPTYLALSKEENSLFVGYKNIEKAPEMIHCHCRGECVIFCLVFNNSRDTEMSISTDALFIREKS